MLKCKIAIGKYLDIAADSYVFLKKTELEHSVLSKT